MSPLSAFLKLPRADKYDAIRFQRMKLLSRLPLCPVRYRMCVGADKVSFWWSYVFMSFVAGKRKLEYVGSDVTYLGLMWRLLRPGMVVLDVGAFHGLYTVIAAKRVGSTGKVVAFEPSSRDRRRLRLHVVMNQLRNVSLEPYAVGASVGVSEFYVVRRGFTTMNSLRPPPTTYPVDRTVAPTTTLDEYCKNQDLGRVAFVKVDIEGGELDMFRGAGVLLRDLRPVVLCEVLDGVTQPWGYVARDIVRYLARYGYQWFEVDDHGNVKEHSEQGAYRDLRNYLAVPMERREAVTDLVRV